MTVVVRDVRELEALVGRQLEPSPWREVSQDRVDAFAAAADDRHWAHNDPAVAARGPFGGTIGHAHLTLALLPALMRDALTVDDGGVTMFYGYDRVRFPAPVPVGRRVRGTFQLASADEVAGAVQLTLDVVVEVEGQDRPACVARSMWRHYPASLVGR